MMDDHVLQMPNNDALLQIQKYYNQMDVTDDHQRECRDIPE
jgi:hypothetical protein